MNGFLWVLQVLLALGCLATGGIKLFCSHDWVTRTLRWPAHFSLPSVRLIGGLEAVSAVGLVVPWALGVAAWITPATATLLAVVMTGAIAIHIRRSELRFVASNAGILLALVIVSLGRFGVFV